MIASVALAGVELGGLTAVAWAMNGRLAPVAGRLHRARTAPTPPYARFDLSEVYAVRYLPCAPCARLHLPHEVDEATRTARCVDCRTTRFLTVEESR
ncbi:hypothetical protein ABZ442_05145 [Streptomyces triculaminicus]|uniref:hypothetical protein n=1 Tax=Streptomyces triculaminicus TaxID=2816232 RepID=UPI0033D9977A